MDINSSAYLKASRALQAAAKSAAEDVSNKSGPFPSANVPRCEPCSSSINHHFTPCPSPAKVIISWTSGLNFLIFLFFCSPALLVQRLFVLFYPLVPDSETDPYFICSVHFSGCW
jgi:hypothetical protein